ncbi:ABC transporter substrate-binding protein [Pararhizobium sp. YC-54]|uniref:ABC transporter substrate-binding protein n=1 Tax=Pararhizobium sp. YC-54 TaxID=2986920 RepID=UPI0021F6B250|nr:ABC transporter substrate-binding protein [Pararhizobium sp. YC-54]MCW0001897.1 ABC transporter substrate-binding protein [Pararhizobium sp. YC-54]
MRISFKQALWAAAFCGIGTSAHAECGKVTITEMNWASGAITTGVAKFLMEQGYGCTVTVVPSSTIPAVTSVAETGEPDILTEIWVSTVPAYKDLEKAGKIKTVAKVFSDGGEEGWWIPAYLAEEHPELKTLDGVLKNPELVGGRFYNCPEGWGCRTRWDNLIPVYGFKEHGIEVFNPGSGETLATAIASAYQDKKPWFGYYWGPTSILGKYPMVRVDRGPYDAAAFACASQPVCADPKPTGDVATEVLTGITTAFEKREPEIAKLLSNLSFTNPQMNDLLAWQEDNKASTQETTVYFLTKYKEVWKSWLSPEAAEKLAELTK